MTAENPSIVTNLSNATLADVPRNIRIPTYDRTKLSPGIVHIGVGNFHRAHQAWYLQRLFEMGIDQDWAIIGAGVRRTDAVQREKLLSQDCLTTLIELDPTEPSAEIVGSMIYYLPVEEGNGTLIQQMTDPRIRIVSLTVTESGYFIDPATGRFDVDHPDIRHDARRPMAPRTAFGAIIAALRLRRERGLGPFTGLSCDNVRSNGEIFRQALVSLAGLSDPDLANWIDKNCTFPNSMVDCIVPATGKAELSLARRLGVIDAVPVTHENFRQWVIEDRFCAGRPRLEDAGVAFSDDVHAYEAQKLRILNAGHQIVANLAEILHIETIAGAMAHPLIRAYFNKVQSEEILPHVVPAPGMTPDQYLQLIERRFANPAIGDTTRRVSFDGSSRHPGFLHPVLREALEKEASVDGLALVEAAWARMCAGTREDQSTIAANDPSWSRLRKAAVAARHEPAVWLGLTEIYGDLANNARFSEAFRRWLGLIWEQGTQAAIRSYCGWQESQPTLEIDHAHRDVDPDRLAAELFRRTQDQRLLVAVAGPAGSGKSTVTGEIAAMMLERYGVATQVMPMDGFHYDNDVLDELGLADRKGAPETFDVAGLDAALDRVSRAYGHADVAVPVFDRSRDTARAGARLIKCHTKLVLVEGNYLLLDSEPWSRLERYFSLSVMVTCEEATLRKRLAARWKKLGYPAADLANKIEQNDIPNGRTVVNGSAPASYYLKN